MGLLLKTWHPSIMFNAITGAITKTSTKEECADAANPNVGEEYQNFVLSVCLFYIPNVTRTYFLPVTPKVAVSLYEFAD